MCQITLFEQSQMDNMPAMLGIPTKRRQDFADGCFQPRARLASQSLGLAALAASLVLCRVMGLSHRGDLHARDGQLPCIFWPSGTSHT